MPIIVETEKSDESRDADSEVGISVGAQVVAEHVKFTPPYERQTLLGPHVKGSGHDNAVESKSQSTVKIEFSCHKQLK